MFTASEFRQYANEAIEAARNALSEKRRKHHIDMAKLWTKAAAELDGDGMMPKFNDATKDAA